MSAPTYDHLIIALGKGAIEVGQGHEGAERLPAILFGRNGAGTVGVETEGDRIMLPGECIAAITFENPESLDVVAEKLAELRARIWPHAAPPASIAQQSSLPTPLLYYRANMDGSIVWDEDCVCQDDVYTGENVFSGDDEETRGGKAYSEAQVLALLAATGAQP